MQYKTSGKTLLGLTYLLEQFIFAGEKLFTAFDLRDLSIIF